MVKGMVEESGGINPHIPEKVYKVRLAGIVEKVLTVEKKDRKGTVILDDKNQPVMEDVERWEWVFGLRQKDGTNEEDIKFTHLTSPKISTKSTAYSFVKALSGGVAPEKGKEYDTDVLIGKYADAVIKDKDPRKDRAGNIQLTSGIKELSTATPTTPEINIEGLVEEEEPDEPTSPTPPAQLKKGRK